jgi:hypothetical protein
MCYCFIFFGQTITNGTPPTRAQTYLKSHKKKDGSYPNDIIKERCVCYSSFISCFTYMCDNFFTINTCLMHQHLIQYTGENDRANTN